ncbi:Multistep phosphorelay regulator [Salix suchowensis]|nr:Multistep phosphorelay regulator [Salix suchowensis]
MESTQKRRNSPPPVKTLPTPEVKLLPVDTIDAPSPVPARELESPVDEDDLADDKTDDGDDNLPSDIIDKEIFNQILDLDDGDTKEFSFEMTAAYLVQAKETFVNMDRALYVSHRSSLGLSVDQCRRLAKDLHELSRLGHYLKGSSAAIGIKKVQASCEKIQHCGTMLWEKASLSKLKHCRKSRKWSARRRRITRRPKSGSIYTTRTKWRLPHDGGQARRPEV